MGGENFIKFQLKMWRWLSYALLTRFYIGSKNNKRNGGSKGDGESVKNLGIEKIGLGWIFLYYFIWMNSLIKILYLLLTYNGLLLEVEFLDKMSIVVYFLMITEMIQETIMWYRKYPMFEILLANFKIQDEVFEKLGNPWRIHHAISRNNHLLVYVHTAIVIIGCSSIILQFYQAPRYPLFTFALVPWDGLPLLILFAGHECLFMWHAWILAAGSIVLCEVFAVTYTNLIGELGKTMKRLAIMTSRPSPANKLLKISSPPNTNINADRKLMVENHLKLMNLPTELMLKHELLECCGSEENSNIPSLLESPDKRPSSCNLKVPGTDYSIHELVKDYKKIMMATSEFNLWVGRIMGGTVGTLYIQFVSDVFIMIQLLKEPNTDFMGVFFFFQDAGIGMFMMFWMIILMSRVYPKSQDFLQEFKNYLKNRAPSSPKTKYLRKVERTLKIIAAKTGGHETNPRSVPKGIHTLVNYYIAAAMWERRP